MSDKGDKTTLYLVEIKDKSRDNWGIACAFFDKSVAESVSKWHQDRLDIPLDARVSEWMPKAHGGRHVVLTAKRKEA